MSHGDARDPHPLVHHDLGMLAIAKLAAEDPRAAIALA
jgi:hypothetical protein